jgi:hypothetical protein
MKNDRYDTTLLQPIQKHPIEKLVQSSTSRNSSTGTQVASTGAQISGTLRDKVTEEVGEAAEEGKFLSQ